MKWGSGAAEQKKGEEPETTFGYTLKEYVEEKSNGRIRVDLYFNNQLGAQTDMFQGLSSGAIESGIINGMTFENYLKKAMVISIPGQFSSLDELNTVLDSDWVADMYQEMTANTGVKVLFSTSNGFRNFTSSKKSLRLGRRKRTSVPRDGEPDVDADVEALGAQPVPMGWGEVYAGLQNGVIDGQENALAAVISNRIYEVQKYMVLDRHIGSVIAGCVSEKWFHSLPEDLQQVVADGTKAGRDAAREMLPGFEEDAYKTLRDNGIKIYDPTPEELAHWQEVMSSKPTDYAVSQIGEEPIQEFHALLEKIRSK
jgi:C4-dicarboxylate-binding protein DctP